MQYNQINGNGSLSVKTSYKKLHFEDIVFQQDNAPVHKLKMIGNVFQENE